MKRDMNFLILILLVFGTVVLFSQAILPPIISLMGEIETLIIRFVGSDLSPLFSGIIILMFVMFFIELVRR